MRTHHLRKYKLLCGVAIGAMAINSMAPLTATAQTVADAAAGESSNNDSNTTTPIKHVITIVGENRTFDHLFATYQPVKQTETVLNLLSEKIINADGTPGSNYASAIQDKAMDTAGIQQIYLNSPPNSGAYQTVPTPLASGGYENGAPPFATVAEALTYENRLPPGYYKYLTTGGVPSYLLKNPDARIYYDGKDVNNLPAGPYQLTNVKTGNPTGPVMTYDDYAESPVHRFYQMWQQLDCSKSAGCQNDLFTWVEATVAAGSNGTPPPANFSYKEGAIAMGFYNVQQGDVPYFKHLADHVLDERQLPSVSPRRHRRQSHHARLRRSDLVQRRQWQSVNAAAQYDGRVREHGWRRRRDRKSEPAAQHQQLVYPGRLWYHQYD
jgi:phospholipase C